MYSGGATVNAWQRTAATSELLTVGIEVDNAVALHLGLDALEDGILGGLGLMATGAWCELRDPCAARA